MTVKAKKYKRIKKVLPSLQEVEVSLARRYFDCFVKRYWDTIIEEPLIWAPHMDVLCEELQTVAERVFQRLPKEYDLVINIPPGTTKSTIATIMFPVWCWVRDPFRETYEQSTASLRFITGSYAAELSLEHSDRSRDILRSDKFQADFPEIQLRKDKDAKSNYANTLKGDRFSTSTGGRATGMHAHIIIIDDPLNPKQAMAETQKELKGANNWISRTLSTRKVNKELTPIIIIMQRLHQNDCSGHVLEKAKTEGKEVRHICLPDRSDSEVKPKALRKIYAGGYLDPIRLNKKVLKEALIDLGSVAYAGQFQQRPSPEGGAMFKVGNIKFMDAIPTYYDSVVRYWDKAATEGAGANTAGVRMIKLNNGCMLITDVVAKQMSSHHRNQRMIQCAELDGRDTKIWTEQEPGAGGKESAETSIIQLSGYSVYLDKVGTSKIARAEPFSAQVEAGNIFLLKADWNKEFLDELEMFPNGTFKDRVDAASGAFNKLTLGGRAGTW